MAIPQSLRSIIPLVIGLAVGCVGAILFGDSMTGEPGSPEEKLAKKEVELKKLQNKLAVLEADPRARRNRPGRTISDGARDIAENIREGKPVTPDDVLRVMQPMLRDLAPLFDRMRVKEEKQMVERMSGEIARKYDLSPSQNEALKRWFTAKSEENARNWTALISQEGTRMEDVIKASREVRADDGLDQFMEGTLSGEKLTRFRTERMAERAERVQNYADSRTQRLDSIVKLDDGQRDRVFGIMATSSNDYDPAMKLEGGVSEISASRGGNKQEALLSVLRPDQREAYDADRMRRREEAEKDLEAIGLSMPADWDPLEMEDF